MEEVYNLLQVGFSFRLTRVCGIVIVLFSLVFSFPEVQAREFYVATASGLQNALTTAQSNGQDETIYLAAGTYSAIESGGSFTYDSTDGDNCTLTISGENGTTPEQIILDGEMPFVLKGKIYTNYMGNYWSDYAGSDNNSDGIGDVPYSINGDKDNYSLIEPFENHFGEGSSPNLTPILELLLLSYLGFDGGGNIVR